MEPMRKALLAKTPELRKMAQLKLGEKIPWYLSSGEMYANNVFRALLGVADAFDQLDRALFYLSSKGKNQTKKKGPRYTDWTWLEYHVYYFVIIYSAVFDRVLIAVNEVVLLGNPAKNCKPEIIKNNVLLTPEIIAALDTVDNYSKKLRGERNLLLHRGHSIDIPKLISSESLDKLKLVYAVAGLDSEFVGDPYIATAMKLERGKVRAELRKYRDDAETAVQGLFDILLPVYQANVGATPRVP